MAGRLRALRTRSPDLASLYLANLAPSGRQGARSMLGIAARQLSGGTQDWRAFDWSRIRAQHVLRLRGWLLEQHYSLWTSNSLLSRVRAVSHLAWRLGYLSAAEWERIRDVPRLSGHPLPAGRALTDAELAALFRVALADRSHTGLRNAALVTVLFCTAIRRAELVALDLEDYDPASGTLKVAGKGRRERIVYVADPAARAILGRWLEAYGATTGPLLPSLTRGRRVRGRLDYGAPYHVLRQLAAAARIRRFSPHDLRRTAITRLAERVGIELAADLAGHADLNSTRAYVRRGDDARRRAAGCLRIPDS